MKKIGLLSLFFSLFISGLAWSETLYVTDRILLGVHQQANENSPVITTIASGTAVTILQRQDSFAKVKLADGKQGWVIESYLKKSKPATAELDATYAKLQTLQESNKKLAADLVKVEREIQIRRDEASNAKTKISELRKALKEQGSAPPPEPVDNTALTEAQETIKTLEAKIAELEQQKTVVAEQTGDDAVVELEKLQTINKEYAVRIEAALATLEGKNVPSAAELAAIRPDFPFWYWLLLVALFVIGAVAGIAWFDFRNRQRHGGFRI